MDDPDFNYHTLFGEIAWQALTDLNDYLLSGGVCRAGPPRRRRKRQGQTRRHRRASLFSAGGRAMKKVLIIGIMGIMIFVFQGCARLDFNEPFRYIPTLPPSGTLNLSVAVADFSDSRPEEDRDRTKEIRDLPEKVTAVVINDLRYSQTFKSVSYRPRGVGEDLLLKGEIERFTWNKSLSPWSYLLPLISALLGQPQSNINADAAFRVTLTDTASGKVVAEERGEVSVSVPLTMYNFQSDRPGAELAECFREAMGQIKAKIAASGKLREMAGSGK